MEKRKDEEKYNRLREKEGFALDCNAIWDITKVDHLNKSDMKTKQETTRSIYQCHPCCFGGVQIPTTMIWPGVIALRLLQLRPGFVISNGFNSSATNKAAVLAAVFVSPAQASTRKQTSPRKIEVVCNDLTKENVDAIVNAANSWLKHGGGVAGAIVRSGGEIIQQESDEYVSKNGPLPTGNVAVTTAGNLPCKAIIHAVGPVWRGGDASENKELQSAVHNSLEECHRLNLASVAVPAISSGIFGFPKDLCAKILFTAAIDFLRSKEDTSLTCIRFTNFDKPTVDVFKDHAASLINKPGLKVEIYDAKSML